MQESQSQRRFETLLFYAAVALLFYLVYRIFEPFLVPLGWGVVLAVCAYPLHERLVRRWGATRAAAASTLLVTLLLVGPALAIAGGLVNEAAAAVHFLGQGRADWAAQLPEPVHRALDWLRQRGIIGEQTDPVQLAREAATRLAGVLAQDAGAVLRNAAAVALKLFIMLFALFFLFRDAEALVARTRNILPFEEPRREEMLAQTRELIFASVTASLIIGAIQGLLGGISFALVALPSPLFWGAAMGLLALLPIIGAWLVWVPAVLWLLAHGEYGKGLFLAGVCGGVAGTMDHFVRPLLLRGKARMSALLILISVLGGISVFGFLGFVLGPIVVAAASSLLDTYTAPGRVSEGGESSPHPSS
jgi:predicted PurR-regulated permease PerM